jgi:hypothetical protein
MKQITLILVIALAMNFCYAQNPFAKYGYDVEVLTLSKGKYNEFVTADTVVQIGLALYDRVNQKLIGFVEPDTTHSEATFAPDVISRWMSPDPLAAEFPSWSPYNYVYDNPINFIDPMGLSPSPVYDQQGNFLGTDSQGLTGKAIVMDENNFTQGMTHEDALANNLGGKGLNSEVASINLSNHYAALKDRPDYDGFVGVNEGIDWAKQNPNALANPTPDNTLYINSATLDFGVMSTNDFQKENISEPQNLLSSGNFARSANNETLRGTVFALGRVDMILTSRLNRTVTIVNNPATDYDWNTGGRWHRAALIRLNRGIAGLDDSHGFRTFYYGVGTLRTPAKPIKITIPRGMKH